MSVDHLTTSNGNNSSIEIKDGLITIRDDQKRVRIIIGQGSGDSVPVLKFYDSNGTESQLGTFLYDLGPNGITRLGVQEIPAEFRREIFKKIPNKININGTFNWSGYSTVTLYRYQDAMRLTRADGIMYYDPVSRMYTSNNSIYDGQYFGTNSFELPDSGYYVKVSDYNSKIPDPFDLVQIDTDLYDATNQSATPRIMYKGRIKVDLINSNGNGFVREWVDHNS